MKFTCSMLLVWNFPKSEISNFPVYRLISYLYRCFTEPYQISKIDFSTKIINAFKPWTTFAKSSILDIWQVSDHVAASDNLITFFLSSLCYDLLFHPMLYFHFKLKKVCNFLGTSHIDIWFPEYSDKRECLSFNQVLNVQFNDTWSTEGSGYMPWIRLLVEQ